MSGLYNLFFGEDPQASSDARTRRNAEPVAPSVPIDQLALQRAQLQQEAYEAQLKRYTNEAEMYRQKMHALNAQNNRSAALDAFKKVKAAEQQMATWDQLKRDMDTQIALLLRARATAAHVAVTAEIQNATAHAANIDVSAYERIR